MAAPKMTKNQMRRAKKKEQKKAQAETTTTTPADSADEKPQDAPEAETSAADLAVKDGPSASDMDGPDGFDIDVVVETSDPAFAEFEDIMKRFGRVAEDEEAPKEEAVFFDQDDDIPSEDEETGQPKLSKKKRKQLNKLSVAELKALVKIPEIVEWQDVSSSDPRLLVQIKAQRNVVPVPPHWSLKREYLSSKRGIEKAPFRLPKFIAETGITEMRDAVLEKQEQQSLSRSSASAASGPRPPYPTLKIPGLNAPPPPGGSWGFHPGGWGKPPVDEFNRPLYGGDIFGLAGQPGGPGGPGGQQQQQQQQQQAQQAALPQAAGEPVEKTLWGELQPRDEESEEEDESEDESDEDDEADEAGDDTAAAGLETPAGLASSVPTDYAGPGIETSVAGEMDLRKARRGFDTEESTHPRAAYQVIPERQQRTEGFFGSDRVYDLQQQHGGVPVLGQDDDSGRKRKKPGDIDVALDPDSLQSHDGISKDELRRRFEEGKKEDGIGAKWAYEEDLSEMIAQESRKRQKVDEKRTDKKKESKYRF
ncbi:splicing factor 3B subunit 2 [Verticillium dahliae VdLs.17]|uniref:Splicing factor 3B subunit 2 n=1 Tax=Verticillium dahliae (strain VdLs.17 / ATCC MYA-4575 / FGSC 10137) TaxID=498257 RepID=G2XIM7_VERDV|nr:splicing factor 3B subunit 2 [Verticillium dahliae VdLs.17]EGY20380.1 splicing factor 3B subunit 2 [Verticillium dahliae VdLs.17]